MSTTVDLHVHSCHSDGVHTATELVRMASMNGLKVIALADHDSVDGVDEAMHAGEEWNIRVLPAVELSVSFRNLDDVHVLGYLINHKDMEFLEKLSHFRSSRDGRGRSIIDRINERLISEGNPTLTYEEVVSTAEGALGRPHIARQLLLKGVVGTMQEAFNHYLEPCNVPKLYFPIEEAFAEIHRIGGITVLAHPPSISTDRSKLSEIIAEMAAIGLDGIECFNNLCYKEDMLFLAGIAAKLGLLTTGGSDYHGGEEALQIGVLRSGLHVPHECVEALLNRKHKGLT